MDNPENIKSCCSRFYENDLVSSLFGENFHPGGEALTLYLGVKLGLNANSLVLDVACGSGSSAAAIAQRFGCKVVGIDLGDKNLARAREKAGESGLSSKLEFVRSDAEKIEFEDATFDAVICECALCTFPDMKTAVSEMYRVLKDGGRIGLTDMLVEDRLPERFRDVLFQVICIAGALPARRYRAILENGGFEDVVFEDHSYALREVIQKIGRLVKGISLLGKLSEQTGIKIPVEEAEELLRTGTSELEKGTLGYGLFSGIKGALRC